MFRYLSSYLPFILVSLFIYGYIFLNNQEATIIKPPLINSGQQAIQVDFLESTEIETEATDTEDLVNESAEIQTNAPQQEPVKAVETKETTNEVGEVEASTHKIKIIRKNTNKTYKSEAYHLATSENKAQVQKETPAPIKAGVQTMDNESTTENVITESIETDTIQTENLLQPEVKDVSAISNNEPTITLAPEPLLPATPAQVDDGKTKEAQPEFVENEKNTSSDKVTPETEMTPPQEEIKAKESPIETKVENIKETATKETITEETNIETESVTELTDKTPEEIKEANEKLHKSIQETPAIIDATLKGDIFNENVKLQAVQTPKPLTTNAPKNSTKNKETKKPAENKSTKKKAVFKKEVNSEAVDANSESQGAMQEAIVVSGNKPVYPQRAILRNKEGRVVVTLTVTSKGKPKDAKITMSSGHEILDDTVLEFVNQELFMPALQGQDKVSSEQVFSFRFELK